MNAPAPRTFDLKNLAVRVATALVFAVFFLTLLWFADRTWAKGVFLGLMALGVAGGARELCLMGRKAGHAPSAVAATLVGWAFLLHFYLGPLLGRVEDPLPLWVVLAGGAAVIHFGHLLFAKDPLEQALTSQAITWMGALYLGLGLGFMVKLFMFGETTVSNTGGRLVFALFFITWLGDTAAYFVGSAFGKHKLAKRVSPKKSWEGAFGNIAGNLLAAFIVQRWVCTDWTAVDAVFVGLLLGTVGQLGDLAESTWKRSVGVKDSNMGIGIPGHGGVLDRVDSLVFAAPALYAYIYFVHGLR